MKTTATTIAQAPPVQIQDGAVAIPAEWLVGLGVAGVISIP